MISEVFSNLNDYMTFHMLLIFAECSFSVCSKGMPTCCAELQGVP